MRRDDLPLPDDLAIDIQSLGLRYGDRTALDQVSIRIPAGSVVGLIGRNGAGKSSLLRCLVGLTVPTQGSSTVLGSPSLALSDEVRGRLGYVSQGADLLGWLTVWQQIETLGSFYPRWDAARARALCERLALPTGQKVSGLSGGDQQKLAIVLALAHDPDVLILDEPVASLDPLTRRDFMRLLFEGDAQRQHPRTVLLSSHLLTDLERVVSHLVFLHEGRIQLQGAWDELQEQHGQPLDELFAQLHA
jgi:ABC-2 type transport system ATP-binding protein